MKKLYVGACVIATIVAVILIYLFVIPNDFFKTKDDPPGPNQNANQNQEERPEDNQEQTFSVSVYLNEEPKTSFTAFENHKIVISSNKLITNVSISFDEHFEILSQDIAYYTATYFATVNDCESVSIIIGSKTFNFIVEIKEETPSKPETPETPDIPDDPDEPENPTDPSVPDEPNTPSNPVEPETPENPDEPTDPETPDSPDNPDLPDNPDTPSDPDEPDAPSDPDEPDEPDNPDPDIPSDDEYSVVLLKPAFYESCITYDLENNKIYTSQETTIYVQYFIYVNGEKANSVVSCQNSNVTINSSVIEISANQNMTLLFAFENFSFELEIVFD